MIATDKPNPFALLGLPIDATRADIVARADELYDTTGSKEEGLLFRWAKEQLITNSQARLEYELFEFPDTEYEDTAWENFVRIHRKKPVDSDTLLNEATAPGLDAIDIPGLLRLFLNSLLLPTTEADISVAIDGSPYVPQYKLPLEVRDVIFG